MNKRSAVRFAVFVVIHILLCVSAALYAAECAQPGQPVSAPDSPVYVDGSDFTPLIELAVFSANGLFSSFLLIVYFAAMTVFSVILLIPFRYISVRKFTVVSPSEPKATLAVILAGAALTILAVMIFRGASAIPLVLLLLIPPLLIEILMYWLTLLFRSRK